MSLSAIIWLLQSTFTTFRLLDTSRYHIRVAWWISEHSSSMVIWKPLGIQIAVQKDFSAKLLLWKIMDLRDSPEVGPLKFCVWVFCLEMVMHPQTYPLIPKFPLGGSKSSQFWRIFKCTFMHVKYVVQRFVPRDLIFWTFGYFLAILESSWQPASDCTQLWASNSMVSS